MYPGNASGGCQPAVTPKGGVCSVPPESRAPPGEGLEHNGPISCRTPATAPPPALADQHLLRGGLGELRPGALALLRRDGASDEHRPIAGRGLSGLEREHEVVVVLPRERQNLVVAMYTGRKPLDHVAEAGKPAPTLNFASGRLAISLLIAAAAIVYFCIRLG